MWASMPGDVLMKYCMRVIQDVCAFACVSVQLGGLCWRG